ncbi:MAG: hypothetical protein ACRD3E_09580, partial [Terriglobales bacterium]
MYFRRILALLLLATSLAAQQPAPARFRIVAPEKKENLADAMNRAATEHYRLVLLAGVALMERTDSADAYEYALVEHGPDRAMRDGLNLYGARGYKVVNGVRGRMFPTWDLLMEKAPGRPNQFQYVLESGHHIKMGTFLPRDDFTTFPGLVAERARAGYSVAAQAGIYTVLEKPAESLPDAAPCTEPACYELRVLDTRKHFADKLTEAGRRRMRFASSAGWQGMSITEVLTLFLGDGQGTEYEYASVPMKYAKLIAPFQDAVAHGFCVRARVEDVIVLERTAPKRCEYRILHGDAEVVTHDLEGAVADGFRPVLLSPEYHVGFSKVTPSYTIFAERTVP